MSIENCENVIIMIDYDCNWLLHGYIEHLRIFIVEFLVSSPAAESLMTLFVIVATVAEAVGLIEVTVVAVVGSVVSSAAESLVTSSEMVNFVTSVAEAVELIVAAVARLHVVVSSALVNAVESLVATHG